MKHFLTISFIFLLVASYAQKQPYAISTQMMSQGSGESISFTEPNIDDRDIEKIWKDYSKDFKARAKGVKRSDELVSEDASLPRVGGTKDVDVYFLANSYGKSTKVDVWFVIDSHFVELSQNPALQKGAETFMDGFQDLIEQWKIEERLDEEEDRLKDLEKDLKKLQKQNERYHKNIEKAKEEIAENERDILKNEQEQTSTQMLLEEQQNRIEQVKQELSEARRN